ncbi:hypothetical protein [uncultured Dysgonomonas sp.]|uniref:Uncharacterized protein n=1 Tax=uncultured Dysgonomonas sp. TaxID=206096 RepID=A0A212K6A3_9BACT|nr:hypothetical protein [uncultured Dysgonomonas sp.]SBW07230.1 conserved hypothetical protein [uncultured Dysgonomonas sp.]
MIYEVKKDEVTLEIDDNVFFDKQPKEFRKLYENGRITDIKDEDGNVISTIPSDNVEFDNCYVEVYDNGSIIITLKHDEDVTV